MEGELRTYFENVAQKLDQNEIALKDFIITKQLTRAPKDYNNGAAQPHVNIALRMQNEQGRTDSELINTFIQYVIAEVPNEKNLGKKAFTPDEFIKKKLTIDKKWYITNQIFPPISRLLEPTEISQSFLAEVFKIDSKELQSMTVIEMGERDFVE